jgi:hypothetical protein
MIAHAASPGAAADRRVRHHRAVPPAVPEPTEACPGCGAVLARLGGDVAAPAGASPSCARLFEVTLHGLRDEAPASAAVAAVVRRADIAYDLQHSPGQGRRPSAWRMTIADVAADLDVIDLTVLVAAWADAVDDDLTAATSGR